MSGGKGLEGMTEDLIFSQCLVAGEATDMRRSQALVVLSLQSPSRSPFSTVFFRHNVFQFPQEFLSGLFVGDDLLQLFPKFPHAD